MSTRFPIVEVRPGVFMLAPGYQSVDGEIVYSAAYLDGGVMAVDHAAVLMDRTFRALNEPEVGLGGGHPDANLGGPSVPAPGSLSARPLLLVPPLEPADER
jgi:hypothetical protein